MKRFLAFLMVLTLLLGLMPTIAFAADDDEGSGSSSGSLEISVPTGVSITLRKGFAGSGSTVSSSSTSTSGGYKTYIYKGLSTGAYSFTTSGSGYNALTKDIYYVSGTTEKITRDPGKKAGNGWEQGSGIERNDEIIGDDGLFATTTTAWPGYEFVFKTPTFTDSSIGQQQFTPHSTMLSFIQETIAPCPDAYYYKVGTSPSFGFEFPAVLFTKTEVIGKTMEEAGAAVLANGKPTIFFQAQIHGNEPSSGEAALSLIYAVATGSLKHTDGSNILEHVNVLVYPRINADGAYKFQRNNVSGGLNMNRGYMSMRSSEVQDVVSLYNAFRPHIVIDAHEWTPDNTSTNSYFEDLWLFAGGSQNNSTTQLNTAIEIMETVFADAETQGIRPYFYTEDMTYDASENILNSIAPVYYGLRGSYAFCTETRGIGIGRGCFERRVFSHYIAAESIIHYAAENADEVVRKCNEERQRIADAGATFDSEDLLVLQHKNQTYSKSYNRPILNLFTNTISNNNNYKYPLISNVVSRSRVRPTAYVLKAGTSGLSQILQIMDYHSIPYVKLEESMTLSLKQYSGSKTSASLSSEKSVSLEAGSYIFPMNHSDGNILAMLMEPDVTDTSASASVSTFVQRSITSITSIYRYEGDIEALLSKLNTPTYTVTFYGTDNQVLAEETVKEGQTVAYTGTIPTKAYADDVHFVFQGWVDVDGSTADLSSITENKEFYPTFSEEQHTYTAATTTEATCTDTGITTYDCSVCHRSYEEEIPSLGHTGELQGSVTPTCTAIGYTGDKVCTVCNTVVEKGTVLPMIPHTEEILPAVEAGCLSSGLTEGKKCSVCGTVLVQQTVLPRLGHEYTYTDNEDGTHTGACIRCDKETSPQAHTEESGICTLCGAGNAQEPTVDPAVEIRHSLNLASDISINYVIAASQLEDYDSYYLECRIPVYEGTVLTGEKTLKIQPELKGSYYYFTLLGITAVEMGNKIQGTLYMEKDGAPYVSEADLYSVADYAYSQIRKASTAQTLKTLCADLLVYGSAAQTYKGYRTDALVADAMTEEEKSYCSDAESVVFGNNNSIQDDVDIPDITWVGKSLSLESKVVVKFVFDTSSYAGAPEELTLRITYTDYTGTLQTVTLSDPTPYSNVATRYAFDFDGLLAAELRTVLDVAIFAGETQVSSTLRYSADTYGNNKTGNLLTLCKTLFAYADAAKAYFGG